MSAFVVDKTHLDALLTAGLVWNPGSSKLRWLIGETELTDYREGEPWGETAIKSFERRVRELTDETAGHVGAMLWAENRRSVNHRYAEDEWEAPYVFEHLGINIDPLVVLDGLSCYEYQSCEHPAWETSEAKAFCDSLRASAIHELPREGERVWEITDPAVFGPRVRRRV